MEAGSSPWNNPDAGIHPLPLDPREIAASLRAGERCMALFPYLDMRFGDRGDAFARTDSGYLATLGRNEAGHVLAQVKWLARVLANRGMPRLLMECHLDILAGEMLAAVPEGREDHAKLSHAGFVLGRERTAVIPQDDCDLLVARFVADGGDLIPNFGGLVVSSVCDEACGIEFAVSSLAGWAGDPRRFPGSWCAALGELLDGARQAACRTDPWTSPQ